MPFENEFASYTPLRRILENPQVKSLLDKLRVVNDDARVNDKEYLNHILKKEELSPTDFLPDYIIAIDGSYHAAAVENGYPGAELGYITAASVLIKLDMVRQLAKNEFIDPKKFRQTENPAPIETVIPGCNMIFKGAKSAKATMRQTLFEELKRNAIFSDEETLLETYEALLGIKISHDSESNNTRKPKSPIEDIEEDMTYGFGEYLCPHTGEKLYSTDAMRLHELMNAGGTNGEMYGQIMSMLEKLCLINILRGFERKGWLPILQRVAFVLDGPLACFSTWSWLNKSIMAELKRINDCQKEISGKDLLIIGLEKTGLFYNHFQDLDIEKHGAVGKFPVCTALLLTDAYIKKHIIFSDSRKIYGEDTYFGRKFFYKTKTGYKVVPVVACFDQTQQNLGSANPHQFTRLADTMNLLDELICSRYPNSISPLVSAHAEAAIPLNLGKKIFESIAKEIRERPY